MLTGQKGVKYGLDLRKRAEEKPKRPQLKRGSFEVDEDSGDDLGSVQQQIARQAAAKLRDRKVATAQAEALAQDPSIFDYDGHYESIQEARNAPVVAEKTARKPKYIANLLAKADERKREQEILFERRLEKERAAEDSLYGNKEKFVTAAYRKKLEENRIWVAEQEEKKRREENEAVERKGHMGDFYRHFMHEKTSLSGESVQLDRKLQPFPETLTEKPIKEAEASQPPIQEEESRPQTSRRTREEEIAAAKQRYLERKRKQLS